MESEGVPLMDPVITAGELKHRVDFQMKVVTRDATGGEVVNWVSRVTAWARVEPLTGRELFTSQQAYPESDTRITVRGPVGAMLNVTDRAFFRNRQFDIVDIGDTDERRIEAIITAIERPAGRNI